MFAALVLAAAAGMPPCWSIFDRALQTSAAAAHPAYVTYDERISITENDRRWIQSTAFVDYRDGDGLARVRDERFDFDPILTRHAEPGPPELGPYGSSRDIWLPHEQDLPTIANVRAQGDMRCEVRGLEDYKGHKSYQLRFSGVPASRPSVKALWVDAGTGIVWKVIVSGFVNVADESGTTPTIANFEVELGYAGPYLVVNHVVWELRHKEYGQSSRFFGEYTLSNFGFPRELPASYFALTASAK